MFDSPRWELGLAVARPTDALTIRAAVQQTNEFTSAVDLAVMPVRFADTLHRLDQMQRPQDKSDDARSIAFNLKSVPMAIGQWVFCHGFGNGWHVYLRSLSV